jgi:hypothetical protein
VSAGRATLPASHNIQFVNVQLAIIACFFLVHRHSPFFLAARRELARPINVEGVSEENADAEKETDGCDGLGHGLAPWLEMPGRNSRVSKRWLNAFTMAGSHGLAEAATTSVAWIKSASQAMLGSVLGKAGRPVMNRIPLF